MSGKRRPLAQRQFDRFQTLAGRRAISRAEMDVQRANRDAANAALKSLAKSWRK